MNKTKTNNTIEKVDYKVTAQKNAKWLSFQKCENKLSFVSDEETTNKATMKYHFVSIRLAEMRSLSRMLARTWSIRYLTYEAEGAPSLREQPGNVY